LGDGEGGFFAGEIVSSATEVRYVGADGGGSVEAGCGSMSGFAFGGAVTGENVGLGGGVAFGDFVGEGSLAAVKGGGVHGWDERGILCWEVWRQGPCVPLEHTVGARIPQSRTRLAVGGTPTLGGVVASEEVASVGPSTISSAKVFLRSWSFLTFMGNVYT